MTISLDQLIYGVRMVETSGRADGYKTVNSIGAVGAYQVMKANIPSWTKEALGRSMTWQQFRDSPAAQDAVARYKLGGYYKKYGPEGAAAMWFSGQPNPNSKASDGGNTVRQYVDKMLKYATGYKGGSGTSATPAATAMPSLGRSVYTAQQAGYQAETRTNEYGAPVNPYKLPGWIASQNQGAAGGTSSGTAQAGFSDAGLFGDSNSVPWDGVSTVVLSTLFVLGGLGLVVVGLVSAISPTIKSAAETAASVYPPTAAASGAVKGATS